MGRLIGPPSPVSCFLALSHTPLPGLALLLDIAAPFFLLLNEEFSILTSWPVQFLQFLVRAIECNHAACL